MSRSTGWVRSTWDPNAIEASDPLSEALARCARTPAFREVLSHPERFRVQALLSEVDGRLGDGGRTLNRFGYRCDAEHIYPASAVKVCVAAAALVRLRELAACLPPPHRLNAWTPLRLWYV